MKNWLGAFAPSQPHIEVSKRPMRAMRYFKIAFCLARYRPYAHSIARVLEEILVACAEVIEAPSNRPGNAAVATINNFTSFCLFIVPPCHVSALPGLIAPPSFSLTRLRLVGNRDDIDTIRSKNGQVLAWQRSCGERPATSDHRHLLFFWRQ
jgi:hypothetical protein